MEPTAAEPSSVSESAVFSEFVPDNPDSDPYRTWYLEARSKLEAEGIASGDADSLLRTALSSGLADLSNRAAASMKTPFTVRSLTTGIGAYFDREEGVTKVQPNITAQVTGSEVHTQEFLDAIGSAFGQQAVLALREPSEAEHGAGAFVPGSALHIDFDRPLSEDEYSRLTTNLAQHPDLQYEGASLIGGSSLVPIEFADKSVGHRLLTSPAFGPLEEAPDKYGSEVQSRLGIIKAVVSETIPDISYDAYASDEIVQKYDYENTRDTGQDRPLQGNDARAAASSGAGSESGNQRRGEKAGNTPRVVQKSRGFFRALKPRFVAAARNRLQTIRQHGTDYFAKRFPDALEDFRRIAMTSTNSKDDCNNTPAQESETQPLTPFQRVQRAADRANEIFRREGTLVNGDPSRLSKRPLLDDFAVPQSKHSGMWRILRYPGDEAARTAKARAKSK